MTPNAFNPYPHNLFIFSPTLSVQRIIIVRNALRTTHTKAEFVLLYKKDNPSKPYISGISTKRAVY
jgi:hypothetical protein